MGIHPMPMVIHTRVIPTPAMAVTTATIPMHTHIPTSDGVGDGVTGAADTTRGLATVDTGTVIAAATATGAAMGIAAAMDIEAGMVTAAVVDFAEVSGGADTLSEDTQAGSEAAVPWVVEVFTAAATAKR